MLSVDELSRFDTSNIIPTKIDVRTKDLNASLGFTSTSPAEKISKIDERVKHSVNIRKFLLDMERRKLTIENIVMVTSTVATKTPILVLERTIFFIHHHPVTSLSSHKLERRRLGNFLIYHQHFKDFHTLVDLQ